MPDDGQGSVTEPSWRPSIASCFRRNGSGMKQTRIPCQRDDDSAAVEEADLQFVVGEFYRDGLRTWIHRSLDLTFRQSWHTSPTPSPDSFPDGTGRP